MNVAFLSPFFPPTAPSFCGALLARGVSVLGIGDEPMTAEWREKCPLTDYVFEPRMAEPSVLLARLQELQDRYGTIDRVDSNGEHWLETEAWLRDELHIPGLRLADVRAQRSKLGMARLFEAAGIDHPPGARVDSASTLQQFAALHGFPLVLKPDTGSGAMDTFTIADQAELERALERSLTSHIVQPYVPGDIITYDGLADRAGEIVFSTAHTYDVGIMQLRQRELDGYYHSLREVPHELEAVGRRVVAAFDIRERFFHVEFFARPDHGLVALEMNLRPPGGFTTDMMNAACDIDVYALWAAALCGEPLDGFAFERKYFTAHAGRRRERRYRLDHEALVKELGSVLVAHRAIPDQFAATMGNTAYLLRHRELPALRAAIALVQGR